MLQCVAVCYSASKGPIHAVTTLNLPPSVLQVCCSVLQCVAVCCSVLQCVAVCCDVLQCVAVSQKDEFML